MSRVATETQTAENRDPASRWLTAGLLTGLVVGILSAPLATESQYREMGGMIGLPTVTGGVIQHLLITLAVFVLFASAVSGTGLRKYTRSLGALAALGVGYAFILWAVYDSAIFPLWNQAAGGASVPVPDFDLESLGEHLVFGPIIGGLYFITIRWLRGRDKVKTEQARTDSDPST